MDPAPDLARLRESAPVTKVKIWNGRSVWLVTRWQDVREVLSSPHFSVSPDNPGLPSVSAARDAQQKSYRTFVTLDAPEHTRFRRMLTKEFTQKRMEELRPLVRDVLKTILDDLEQKGPPADLIEEIALGLPTLVISLLLGVPYEDRIGLQDWTRNRMELSVSPELTMKSARAMEEYMDQYLASLEKSPGTGETLLSRLVLEQILPGRLSRAEAVQMCAFLYLAGHETTANQIGLGILTVMQNPDQRALMTASTEALKNGVEEMLRYHSVAHINSARVATAPVVIGGQTIQPGEGVYALVCAANRDPEAFPDPDRFDVQRSAKDHIAFSYGVHQCLGQPLVRLELQELFRTLFERFPKLELAVPFEELSFKEDGLVYGLRALPVRW